MITIASVKDELHRHFPAYPVPPYPPMMGMDPLGVDEYASFANVRWNEVPAASYGGWYDICPPNGFSSFDPPHMWNYHLPGFLSFSLADDERSVDAPDTHEMVKPEEHTSPDGMLILAVESLEDDDYAIGFRGFGWHTHADILASLRSTNETDAVRQFVDDVLSDRSLIAVQVIDGKTHDVWITDDPAEDSAYQQPNEKLRFRYWSGREVLIDGNDTDGLPQKPA